MASPVALRMFPTKKPKGWWRAWIKGTNFSSPVDVFFCFPSILEGFFSKTKWKHTHTQMAKFPFPSRKKWEGINPYTPASSVFCSHLVVPPCEALISQDEEILLTWPGWSCRRGLVGSGWDGSDGSPSWNTQRLPRDLPGLYWATGYFLQFGASSCSRYPHNWNCRNSLKREKQELRRTRCRSSFARKSKRQEQSDNFQQYPFGFAEGFARPLQVSSSKEFPETQFDVSNLRSSSLVDLLILFWTNRWPQDRYHQMVVMANILLWLLCLYLVS